MTPAELDAIRDRAAETAARYDPANLRIAERDRATLLSHVYDLSKRHAEDTAEIRRLTRERDCAREALRVSEQHVRELSGRECVVYRNCDKHRSVPWTTLASFPRDTPAREVCPICEPPK